MVKSIKAASFHWWQQCKSGEFKNGKPYWQYDTCGMLFFNCSTMKPQSKQKNPTMSILVMLTLMLCLQSSAQSQPVANFSSNIVSGCSPILVNFTDQSTGNPAEWKWDLGNGTISNLQNPSVTYFNPGFYTVKLVIKAGNRKDSVIKTNYIHVFPSAVVNFNASNTIGCNPFTVNFTNQTTTTGNVSNWQWDFGDGILSSIEHPSHTYTLPGNYPVTLKVTTGDGCMATLRKSGYINNNVITAAFTNKTFAACTPNQIVFQNTSTGNMSFTSKWNFGDGNTSLQSSPVHLYGTGGNYTVQLIVQNQAGCTDTLNRSITVANPVSAAFTADQVNHCLAPATINFTCEAVAGSIYSWTFGDSTKSSVANPSHEYTDTGVYTVKLIVKNVVGCKDSVMKTDYIRIQKPFVLLNNLPDSGCVPFIKSFSATNASSYNIASYLWNFGDGNSSFLPAPNHTFSNTGSYNISVVATGANGCKDTAFLNDAIRVSTQPHANFSASTNMACASSTITFTDLSTGGVNSWLWSFGDNDFSSEQNPAHVYKDTGWMTVQLIAMNGGCADIITLEKYIYVKPAVAKFSIEFDCNNKMERTFSNYSIDANRFTWDFGDGSTSSDSSPVHHFPGPGNYTVTLFAMNDSTHCDYTLTKRVKVLDIHTNFFASDTSVCKKTSVVFTTTARNSDILKYYWDFGDNNLASTRVNTTNHIYKNTGVYNITLITVDSLSCTDTITKPLYISILGPRASFGVVNGGGCINSPVVFSDSSVADITNPVQKWNWYYGDGESETVTSPPFSHTYHNNGLYTVALKVTDINGCTDSVRITTAVIIKKPIATFYAYDSIVCPGFPAKLVCPYAENGIIYNWDFGDGSTGNTQYPSHSYLHEGVYTIKLIVRNKYGCEDTCIKINMIRVKKTIASFSMSDSFRTCPPLIIQFTNHSSGDFAVSWNFGDSTNTDAFNPSHFYTYPGNYTATMIAQGPGGCADTMSKTIIVKGPKGTINYSPLSLCKPYQVNFIAHTQDAASYIWDFNDGVTALGADTAIRYTYQDSGYFLPKIILIDDIGCRVAITGRDTIKNIFIAPKFQFPDSILCNTGNILFNNKTNSNDFSIAYLWNFDDNTSSAEVNPTHQYLHPGVYYPSLTAISSNGCREVYHSPVPVKVIAAPQIDMITTGNGCAPLTASFNAVITSGDSANVNWSWNLGNNNTSVLQQPPAQLFSNAGVYTISLTANIAGGCTKTIQKTVEAFATPAVKINGNNFLCKGLSLSLAASGGAQYKWYPATSLNCDTCITVIAKPLVSTQYIVTGKSVNGCIGSDSVMVTVKQPFVMKFSKDAGICKGQTSRLEAGGADSYQWYPANTLSNATIANPVAQPDSTTNYRIIGADNAGCFKDTGYIKLTVFNIPTVNAGTDKTISTGTPVDLEAVYSSDVIDVRWSPTGDVFRAGTNIITVKPTQNTEYTIEVKNQGGCHASDRVNVMVKFDGSNVFIPNLFSPNSDGVNDIFYPRGKGIYKIRKMAIFSRWGEVVFEKTNFNSNDASAGWDGTFKGSPLTTDVFVYIVELIGENGTILPLTGNVSLVR
jgi:gliding motility-associated-like protein